MFHTQQKKKNYVPILLFIETKSETATDITLVRFKLNSKFSFSKVLNSDMCMKKIIKKGRLFQRKFTFQNVRRKFLLQIFGKTFTNYAIKLDTLVRDFYQTKFSTLYIYILPPFFLIDG